MLFREWRHKDVKQGKFFTANDKQYSTVIPFHRASHRVWIQWLEYSNNISKLSVNEIQIFKLQYHIQTYCTSSLEGHSYEMRQNSKMDMTSNTVHVWESLAGTWLGQITFFKHLAKKCGKLVWLTTDDSLHFPTVWYTLMTKWQHICIHTLGLVFSLSVGCDRQQWMIHLSVTWPAPQKDQTTQEICQIISLTRNSAMSL